MEFIKGNRDNSDGPVCDSGIFCYGKLLEVVQMAKIFPDSKTFVDMKLKYDVKVIGENFDRLTRTRLKPSRERIRQV